MPMLELQGTPGQLEDTATVSITSCPLGHVGHIIRTCDSSGSIRQKEYYQHLNRSRQQSRVNAFRFEWCRTIWQIFAFPHCYNRRRCTFKQEKRAWISEDGQVTYISSSSEDLGKDHSGEPVSAIVQCGYNKFKHGVLVLQRAQIEQAKERKRWVKQKGINQPGSILVPVPHH